MNKKSGTAGTPVEPVAPTAAFEADEADPGEVSEAKAEQRQTQSGKYGSTRAVPFKPPSAAGGAASSASATASSAGSSAQESGEETELSWIEIELVGEDDKPIPGEKYRITLPDGTADEGTLDQNGWARVEGFEKGDCQITFPNLDQEAWEYIESVESKAH